MKKKNIYYLGKREINPNTTNPTLGDFTSPLTPFGYAFRKALPITTTTFIITVIIYDYIMG